MLCDLDTEEMEEDTVALHANMELRWEKGGFAFDECTNSPLPFTTAKPVRDIDTSKPRKHERDKLLKITATR